MILRTRSRIHITLIDMNGDLGRIDGGVGFALKKPYFEIEVKKDENIVSEDREAYEIATIIRKRYGTGGAHIKILNNYQKHIGLGSGTQFALGVATSLLKLYNIKVAPQELAKCVRRGGTSAIGTYSFFMGGFILDGGHSIKEKSEFMPSSAVRDVSLAPLVLRYDFPEEWKIALVIPEKSRKIFDIHEKNLFLKYCPIDRREVERVSHIILMNLLPALCEKDLDMFGKAIQMIQNVGFKKIEIKEQNNIVKKVLNILNEDYFAGMSSFGPTIYVITDTNEKEIKKIGKEFGCNVFITECANKGYEMVE